MTEPLRKVLVIDDEPALLTLLIDALSLLGGYDVVVASDGVIGLEQVLAEQPDCVVVDVRMPNLNGFQFVRAIRGDPATATIPLVILSALAQDRQALMGFLSGADAYLFKPVELDDLLASIDKAVRLTDEERRKRFQALAEAPPPDEGR
jgi:two-component system alkaline phosphatase synthesis response regulator PhoP